MRQYFSLSPDMYLVKGHTYCALYDVSGGQVYRISKTIELLLQELIENGIDLNFANQDKKNYIENLVKNKLIVNVAEPKKHFKDITTLREKHHRPSFAWIEVTKACNLQCAFCYENSSPSCLNRMNKCECLYVLEELHRNNIKHIQFIGGEPLLMGSELKDIIFECGKNFDFIEIFTNGTLINEEWCDFLKNHSIVVAISIHSYDPEEHDRITGVTGSHNKVVNAIRLLLKHRIKHRVCTVRTACHSVGNYEERVTPCKLQPKNVILTGRGTIDQYDFDMFRKKAITKETMHNKKISGRMIIQNVSGHRCFLRKLYISANLDVFPCAMERRLQHGSLKSNSLKNILSDKIMGLSKDYIEVCKDCEYRYMCNDCRPDANGASYHAKPWFCSYDPYTGEWKDLEIIFGALMEKAQPMQ